LGKDLKGRELAFSFQINFYKEFFNHKGCRGHAKNIKFFDCLLFCQSAEELRIAAPFIIGCFDFPRLLTGRPAYWQAGVFGLKKQRK
jgi:hypothetical protein